MPRYIDADYLLNVVERYFDGLPIVVHHDMVEFIKNAPTADVVEREKGKWLPYEFGNERWHNCSACGKADEYINE